MAVTSATPRRSNLLLPLLPSRPGGVYNISPRGNRCAHHVYSSAPWSATLFYQTYYLAEREGLLGAVPGPLAYGPRFARSKCAFLHILPNPAFYKPRARILLIPVCQLSKLVLSIKLLTWRRERDSNPRCAVKHTHAFQACPFDRSGTSPRAED